MNGKPNLLIIQTDEQSLNTLGVYGNMEIETPNIDRIGKEGIIFNNFFTCTAVCTPSRGCFLTGRYPHSHGAFFNDQPLHRNEITLAHILKANGYSTGYSGKWHLDNPAAEEIQWISKQRSMGFDDCKWMFNRGHKKSVVEYNQNVKFFPETDKGRYMTDWLIDKTAEFIITHKNEPFFYMTSVPDPHMPFTVREPYASMFQAENMSLPETFWEEAPLPRVVKYREEKLGKNKTGISIDNPDREITMKQYKAGYFGEIKCIDDAVGRLLYILEQKKILDNTIIVFTSDHGDYMGEHTIYSKNMLYESVYHIPLLVRCPELIAPHTINKRYICITDFMQTILGLMNITGSGREQGRDASCLLRNNHSDWNDEIYIHHPAFTFEDINRPNQSYQYAGIITPEYELVLARDGNHILFDRQHDPDQLCNIAGSSSKAGITAELSRKIMKHNAFFSAPAYSWLADIV